MSLLTDELMDRARHLLKVRGIDERGGFRSYTDEEIKVETCANRFSVYRRTKGGAYTECYVEFDGKPGMRALHYSDLIGEVLNHMRKLMLLDDLARDYEPPPDSVLDTLRE